MGATTVLVVIPVRDDAETLDRAVRSARAAQVDVEVVVVDDGSERPATVSAAHVVRTEPAGVSAARNRGATAGPSELLVFLDADDELLPGWAELLSAPFVDEAVAAVCGGAEIVPPDGEPHVRRPDAMGPAFGGARGLFLAGSFAVRHRAFDSIGGYDRALAFSENTELALRLTRWCASHGQRIVAVDDVVVRVHQRDSSERRSRYAAARLAAVERLFARHGDAIAKDASLASDYARVAGAAAAHLGRYSTARQWFRRSKAPADLARVALTFVPVARARVWGTADA